MSGVCDRYGLPYVWKLYPPPAVGGLIRTFNVFRAFIDLDLETQARPTLLQVNDLVKQAVWRCEQEIAEASSPKPFNPVRKLAGLSGGVSSILNWLFPSEKQRLVVGWIIVVTLVGLMLRYVFGFHPEDIGKKAHWRCWAATAISGRATTPSTPPAQLRTSRRYGTLNLVSSWNTLGWLDAHPIVRIHHTLAIGCGVPRHNCRAVSRYVR